MLQHIKLAHGVFAANEEDLSEALKRIDDRKDECEEYGVPHLRRGDEDELLPAGGAVEVCGLKLILRNRDEAGQKQNDAVAGALPQVHTDHDPERVRADKPLLHGQAKLQHQIVHDAGLIKEQVDEQHRACDRHDVREQEYGF